MNTFEMKTAIHFGADALGRLRDIPYMLIIKQMNDRTTSITYCYYPVIQKRRF